MRTPDAVGVPASPGRRRRCWPSASTARFTDALGRLGIQTATGRFGAEMRVELVNDGPFTIWLDTDDR